MLSQHKSFLINRIRDFIEKPIRFQCVVCKSRAASMRRHSFYRWIDQARFAIFFTNAHILSVSEVHGLLSLAGIGEIVRSGNPGHGSLF